MIKIACMCPKCGRWNAVNTNNLNKAGFICKSDSCKKYIKIRGVGMFNCRYRFPMHEESLSDLVSRLNYKKEVKHDEKV